MHDPKVGGFDEAKRLIAEGSLAKRYGHFDLWLFLPDADCQTEFAGLEEKVAKQMAEAKPPGKARLFVCAFQPEVEICVIAGHPKAKGAGWQQLRRNPRFKEEVFQPFLKSYGNPSAPGGGRERLMREALQNYPAIKRKCPEVAVLEQRLAEFFGLSGSSA